MEYTEYIEEDEHSAQKAQSSSLKEVISREAIDSLPYIDAFDDAAQLEAQRLIDLEARTFRNEHAVSAVTVSFQSDSLNEEYERLKATEGRGWTAPIAKFEESLVMPAQGSSLAVWEAAVARAKIYYEYVKNRVELLELQQQFGANAWLEHNRTTEHFRDHFKALLAGYKAKIEQINIERKTMQLQTKLKLANLEKAFQDTAKRNFEIEAACRSLEAQQAPTHV